MNRKVNGEQDPIIPLDTLLLPFEENGVTKEIPALNPKWVVERYYVPFWPPPVKEEEEFVIGAKDSWLERASYFRRDMKWLLHLKQHQFWSQVIYDNSTMAAIVSFLQEAPPFYLLNEVLTDEDMWVAYDRTLRLVLQVIKRITTREESEASFMSAKLHGDLMYDCYLLTVPVLLDLCSLCWPSNRPLLQGLFNDIFNVQPKYLQDLNKSVACITQVLDCVSQCLGLSVTPSVDGEPALERLDDRLRLHQGPITKELLRDLVVHVLDSSSALAILTDVCTESCTIFHAQSFEFKLVWFYENVFPEMYSRLETLVNVDEDPVLFVGLKSKIDTARVELLKTFRHILFTAINTAVESRDPQEVMNSVDEYVNVLTECLVEKLFMNDYHTIYNVGHDLDILAQLSPDMDPLKRTYILEAVINCLDEPEMPVSPTSKHRLLPPFSSYGSASGTSHRNSDLSQPGTSGEATSVKRQTITGVKLVSLITQVRDVMPHLGEGFVEKCLEYYDYVSENVINAVLEERLPPDLQDLDQSLPRAQPSEQEVLAQRVDTRPDSDDESEPKFAQAHKGKRNDKYRDVMMLINDKTHREDLRDFYTMLSLYEDEYDDTYDEHQDVSAQDDTVDPERFRRAQPEQRTEQRAPSPNRSSGDDSSENEESAAGDQFLMNPEKVRALQEQRRQAKAAARGGGGGGGGGHRGPRGDVVGRPKGQGQDKNVTTNRNQKSANKGQRANHNRRSGASWKRRQGMVPS